MYVQFLQNVPFLQNWLNVHLKSIFQTKSQCEKTSAQILYVYLSVCLNIVLHFLGSFDPASFVILHFSFIIMILISYLSCKSTLHSKCHHIKGHNAENRPIHVSRKQLPLFYLNCFNLSCNFPPPPPPPPDKV